MKHFIIKINEEQCVGCGDCVAACHEGALQLVNGKAKLVKEFYCAGLGHCIGHCAAGALTLQELDTPEDHGSFVTPKIPTEKSPILLNEENLRCPGSLPHDIDIVRPSSSQEQENTAALSHWPIQLHLISPEAACFNGASLLVAADCTAFAMSDFHRTWLKDRKLVIACPKLDGKQEDYVEKLRLLIDRACVKDITIMIMNLPCCKSLTRLVLQGVISAQRHPPIQEVIVSKEGGIIQTNKI